MKLVARTLLATLVLAGSVAQAQAPASSTPQPSLNIAVRNTTAETEKGQGKPRSDAAVRPGDVLRYTLTFTNPSARALSNVQLSNPLPAGLVIVDASTRASRTDAVAEFSADSGKTFSAKPVETVVVDGQTVTRPVPPSRFTNVRWVVRGQVRPKTVVTAEYDARVGTAPSSSEPASSGR